MNQPTSETLIAALRDLDPAPEVALSAEERQRADRMFARVVAAPSDGSRWAEPDRPRRRRWRLLVPMGLVGAAGAAIAALLLGGSAFASWTPTPEPLTPAKTSAAAATCRAAVGIRAGGEATLLAEQRGKWTYVLVSGPKAEASCLMRNEVVGQDPNGQEVIGTLDTKPGKSPTVASDHIVEMSSTAASTDEGWFREGWLTAADGYVGSDVIGVTVHTPLGFDVEASVGNGRFAAWWPSDPPSSKNLDVMGAWSYTVTLADGTTRPSE